MAGNIKSALIAGLIAFVAYVVISLLTGVEFGSAVGVGLIFFVGTALVTFVITLIIIRVKANGSAS